MPAREGEPFSRSPARRRPRDARNHRARLTRGRRPRQERQGRAAVGGGDRGARRRGTGDGVRRPARGGGHGACGRGRHGAARGGIRGTARRRGRRRTARRGGSGAGDGGCRGRRGAVAARAAGARRGRRQGRDLPPHGLLPQPVPRHRAELDSILGSNNGQDGHYEEHQGPIFYPDIPKHTEWGDIIPPFSYLDDEDEVQSFPGYNWDAQGQAIYAADCAFAVPNPTFEYTIDACVDGDLSYFEFTLSGLLDTVQYRVDLYTEGGSGVEYWTITDTEGSFTGSYYLPPGGYYVEVWVFNDDEQVQEWELVETIEFTVDECPLAVTAAGTACSLGDDGSALVSISGLVVGEDYDWILSGDAYLLEGTLVDVESTSMDVPFGDLPPGNYFFEISTGSGEGVVLAYTYFFVDPCPPAITVVVTECPAYGGQGSALLQLSGLVEGVEYDVWVTAKGDVDGTVYGDVQTVVGDSSHTTQIKIGSLPAGMSYTAWVSGVWMIPEGVEVPEAVESVVLETSVDFTLKPCPAKPVTPAGLAATGMNDPTGPIAAALLLLGLGGAALVARARREGSFNRGE